MAELEADSWPFVPALNVGSFSSASESDSMPSRPPIGLVKGKQEFTARSTPVLRTYTVARFITVAQTLDYKTA